MNQFYYLDTNALVKLVLQEKGHDEINKLYDSKESCFIISNLSITEINSALIQKLSRNEINEEDYEKSVSLFHDIILRDSQTSKIFYQEIGNETYKDAIPLIRKYKSLRTLDSLHLVTALAYKELDLIFITADKKLKRAASSEGLRCLSMNECLCPKCGHILLQCNSSTSCNECGHVNTKVEMRCSNSSCDFICESCNKYVCEKYNSLKEKLVVV